MSDCTTRSLPSLTMPRRTQPHHATPREQNIPAQRTTKKEDAMIKSRNGRRAGMSENKNLSRRARTILAVDSLLASVGNDPNRVTRQDIATSAANWTVDELDMFMEPGGDEPEYTDYYELINSLMHIVHAMRNDQ